MKIPNSLHIMLPLAIGSILIACKPSSSNDFLRLSRLADNIQKVSKVLEPEDEGRVRMIDLQQNEAIVIINGSYAGSISNDSHISEKLTNEIRSTIVDESWDTYLLLIRNNRVVAKKTISMDNFMTSTEPLGNNAKLAYARNKHAVLNCKPRKVFIASGVWNSKCYTVLVGFD